MNHTKKLKVTRVDLADYSDALGYVQVSKWGEGWKPWESAALIEYKTDPSFVTMVKLLEGAGWTVKTWPAFPSLGIPRGARAWRNRPRPVRTRDMILATRRYYDEKVTEANRRGVVLGDNVGQWVRSLDLAYTL